MNKRMKKATDLPLFLLLALVLVAAGCDKDETPEEPKDPLEGTYTTNGKLMSMTYNGWPNIDNSPPAYDTTAISLKIRLEKVKDSSSRYRIYGMTGLDMRREEGPCRDSFYCGFFATYTASSAVLSMDSVSDPGGQAWGSGSIKGDSLYYTYYFHYRNIYRAFRLAGKK
jgi:hypothetical protein